MPSSLYSCIVLKTYFYPYYLLFDAPQRYNIFSKLEKERLTICSFYPSIFLKITFLWSERSQDAHLKVSKILPSKKQPVQVGFFVSTATKVIPWNLNFSPTYVPSLLHYSNYII